MFKAMQRKNCGTPLRNVTLRSRHHPKKRSRLQATTFADPYSPAAPQDPLEGTSRALCSPSPLFNQLSSGRHCSPEPACPPGDAAASAELPVLKVSLSPTTHHAYHDRPPPARRQAAWGLSKSTGALPSASAATQSAAAAFPAWQLVRPTVTHEHSTGTTSSAAGARSAADSVASSSALGSRHAAGQKLVTAAAGSANPGTAQLSQSYDCRMQGGWRLQPLPCPPQAGRQVSGTAAGGPVIAGQPAIGPVSLAPQASNSAPAWPAFGAPNHSKPLSAHPAGSATDSALQASASPARGLALCTSSPATSRPARRPRQSGNSSPQPAAKPLPARASQAAPASRDSMPATSGCAAVEQEAAAQTVDAPAAVPLETLTAQLHAFRQMRPRNAQRPALEQPVVSVSAITDVSGPSAAGRTVTGSAAHSTFAEPRQPAAACPSDLLAQLQAIKASRASQRPQMQEWQRGAKQGSVAAHLDQAAARRSSPAGVSTAMLPPTAAASSVAAWVTETSCLTQLPPEAPAMRTAAPVDSASAGNHSKAAQDAHGTPAPQPAQPPGHLQAQGAGGIRASPPFNAEGEAVVGITDVIPDSEMGTPVCRRSPVIVSAEPQPGAMTAASVSAAAAADSSHRFSASAQKPSPAASSEACPVMQYSPKQAAAQPKYAASEAAVSVTEELSGLGSCGAPSPHTAAGDEACSGRSGDAAGAQTGTDGQQQQHQRKEEEAAVFGGITAIIDTSLPSKEADR